MGAIKKFIQLKKAQKRQYWSEDKLKEYQYKKLKKIVKYSYDNVPFLHNKFKKHGFNPDQLKSLEDISLIPFTTKGEIRKAEISHLISNEYNLDELKLIETSGSTGTPMKIAYDEPADDFSKAINLRSHIENGMGYFDEWVIFADPEHFPQENWFQKFGLLSPHWLSLYEKPKFHYEKLKEIDPDILSGYTSSIRILAEYVGKNNLNTFDIKKIFTTSELLTPQVRKIIQNIFDADVIDHFGCVEVNRTAWECSQHNGYHLDIDSVITEFVRGDEKVSPGEEGEIVYTSLYNFAMPLIRYKVGDMGVPTDYRCDCGRTLPLMKDIKGRVTDYMQNSKGEIFSPIIWTTMMRKIEGITKFKAVQEKKDFIKLNLEDNENMSAKVVQKSKNEIKRVMGEDMAVETEVVKNISKEGKKRSAISKIDIDWNMV